MDHTAAPHSDLASDTHPNPLLKFWEALAFYMDHAFSLFGHPAKLAQRLWLTRRDHKMFCDYIRPLEDMVRRLIFMLALELAPMTLPATPERKYRARLAMPANAGASFDMDNPETWRVSFKLGARSCTAGDRLAASPKQAGEGAGAPSAPAQISSAPSAARLEALLRAINHRERYADALARKLARDARIALAYTNPVKPKLARKTGYDMLVELIPHCAEAQQRSLHRKLDALLLNTS